MLIEVFVPLVIADSELGRLLKIPKLKTSDYC